MPSPIRFSQAETVESAKPRVSVISDAVIRTLRNASIARTVASGVRWGIRLGAELRSSSPVSPSERHLRADRC